MALAVTAAFAVACGGDPERGTPSPGGSAAQDTATGTTVPPAPRPAELPLDTVQPCRLVADDLRAAFAIDRPDQPSSAGPGTEVCTLLSSTTGSYLVALERQAGIDRLERPVNTTVGGFPAVDIRQEGVRIGHLSIDVADGQRLDVEVQRLSGDQPVDLIHQDTLRFAEAVLASLRQQLGR
ncbi:MAG TPA: DUF3558 family protein [Pseudonocardiaceae bacterium]